MTETPELDRAIEAADRVISEDDRTYARALVAELLRGIEDTDNDSYSSGFNAALAEIRRRAGLEGEG